MMTRKPSVNWNDSYQNPFKKRHELDCTDLPDAIPAEDRALYLGMLMQQVGRLPESCCPKDGHCGRVH